MGAKSSKLGLDRNSSIRKSQKQQFQEIKQKCDNISTDIKDLSRDDLDENYVKIKNSIIEVKDNLQAVSLSLKEKHKNLYDEYVNKCHKLSEELEENYKKLSPEVKQTAEEINKNFEEIEHYAPESPNGVKTPSIPITPPTTPNRLTTPPSTSQESPKIETESDDLRHKKQTRKKRRSKERKETKDEICLKEIHKVRLEMVPFRDEVLVYKGPPETRLYHFLEETFLRFLKRLDEIETFDHVQLKHEKKTAIAYAKESMEVLKELANGKNIIDINRHLNLGLPLANRKSPSPEFLMRRSRFVDQIGEQVTLRQETIRSSGSNQMDAHVTIERRSIKSIPNTNSLEETTMIKHLNFPRKSNDFNQDISEEESSEFKIHDRADFKKLLENKLGIYGNQRATIGLVKANAYGGLEDQAKLKRTKSLDNIDQTDDDSGDSYSGSSASSEDELLDILSSLNSNAETTLKVTRI